MALYNPVQTHECFAVTCYLQLQGRRSNFHKTVEYKFLSFAYGNQYSVTERRNWLRRRSHCG